MNTNTNSDPSTADQINAPITESEENSGFPIHYFVSKVDNTLGSVLESHVCYAIGCLCARYTSKEFPLTDQQVKHIIAEQREKHFPWGNKTPLSPHLKTTHYFINQ